MSVTHNYRRLQTIFAPLLFRSIQKGFTVTELIVVMTVLAILIGLVTINLANASHHASLDAGLDSLVADIHRQQIKAMNGNTGGRVSTDNYGVHFETNTYTLFHGTTYSSSATDNFTITLPGTLQFANVIFPSNQLIFTKGSGEVSGFSSGQNTFVVKDTADNNQKTVTINKLGVITGIN